VGAVLPDDRDVVVARQIDAVVRAVEDELVRALGRIERSDGGARRRIDRDEAEWLPRHDEETLVRFVECDRRVVLALLDGPRRDRLERRLVDHGDRVLAGNVDEYTIAVLLGRDAFGEVRVEADIPEVRALDGIDRGDNRVLELRARVFAARDDPRALRRW